MRRKWKAFSVGAAMGGLLFAVLMGSQRQEPPEPESVQQLRLRALEKHGAMIRDTAECDRYRLELAREAMEYNLPGIPAFRLRLSAIALKAQEDGCGAQDNETGL